MHYRRRQPALADSSVSNITRQNDNSKSAEANHDWPLMKDIQSYRERLSVIERQGKT